MNQIRWRVEEQNQGTLSSENQIGIGIHSGTLVLKRFIGPWPFFSLWFSIGRFDKFRHTRSVAEAAILACGVHPERDDLSPEAAKALLQVGLEREDLDRLHLLITKNQEDALTPSEKADLESYLRISSFFDLMHAKARRSLKKHS